MPRRPSSPPPIEPRRLGAAALFAASVVAGAACEGESTLVSGDALAFAPGQVTFEPQSVGVLRAAGVELVNRGGASLRIRAVRFVPDDPAFQLAPRDGSGALVGLVVRPGRPLAIDVRFAPAAAGRHDAVVEVETERAVARLELFAEAVRVSADAVTLEPPALDFGSVLVGEVLEREASVRNGSGVPVPILGVEPASAGLGLADPLPTDEVPPGGARTLTVVFSPSAPAVVDEALQLVLPGEGRLSLPVRARVEAPGRLDCPLGLDLGVRVRGEVAIDTARCGFAEGAVRIRDVTVAPGSDDRIVVTDWRADGEGVEVDVRFAASGLAGPVVAGLELEASAGTGAGLDVSAEVAPPPAGTTDLSATLSWDALPSDLDLHLVRARADPFTRGDDCYWADKNPDWGAPGEPLDDPFLDRDATDGSASEIVNLERAAESVYDVYVQYHADPAGSTPRPTTATVRIRLGAQPAVELTRTLPSCGSLWHVARVRGGAVEPVGTVDQRFREFAAPPCR